MAFGLMSSKWRVLRTPLQTSLKTTAIILDCCSKLHNLCINQDGDQFLDENIALREILPMPGSDFGWGFANCGTTCPNTRYIPNAGHHCEACEQSCHSTTC